MNCWCSLLWPFILLFSLASFLAAVGLLVLLSLAVYIAFFSSVTSGRCRTVGDHSSGCLYCCLLQHSFLADVELLVIPSLAVVIAVFSSVISDSRRIVGAPFSGCIILLLSSLAQFRAGRYRCPFPFCAALYSVMEHVNFAVNQLSCQVASAGNVNSPFFVWKFSDCEMRHFTH